MTHKARLRWARVLGLLVLIGGSAIWILHWNSEEHSVYEAVIREAFSGDGVSYFHSEKLGLPLSARASYTAKNLFRFHVPPKMGLPHPFTMVGQEELDKVYRPGQTDSLNAV